MHIKSQKDEIRNVYLARRNELALPEREKTDEVLCSHFLSLASYRYADVLLLYYPIGSETGINRIAKAALESGKRIAYPKTFRENSFMSFHYVNNIDELVSGSFGLSEPAQTAEPFIQKENLHTICIVPGLVFDLDGYRIGYGKGYYDRFLKDFSGTKIGLVRSDFLLDRIPRGRYDIAVDVLVTDRGIKTFYAG